MNGVGIMELLRERITVGVFERSGIFLWGILEIAVPGGVIVFSFLDCSPLFGLCGVFGCCCG